ncbi:MAG: alpha/beta fold hydrolase [Burkholderiaceae bacterium]
MLALFIQIAIACSVAVMFLLALWLPGLLVLATAFGVVLFYCAWLAMQFRLMVAVNANEDADAGHSFALLARSWWLEVVVSIQAFAWWQPFRSKANPDQVPPCAEEGAGQRGIVLVHGFACNRGIWMPWFEKLRKRRIPYIAVNLEPVLGSIDDYSPLLDKAVSAMFSATGAPPLLVGHSMGGLAARAWLRRMQDSTRVHQFVTIGTPHHGTLLGHFGPRMSALVNGNQMRFGSPWLTELARSESLRCCKMFTCFYSNCDNIVMPTGSATLNGADNRLISGVPHLAMVADESIIEQTLAML